MPLVVWVGLWYGAVVMIRDIGRSQLLTRKLSLLPPPPPGFQLNKMMGFLSVIGSILPASRRAARELEKIKIVKETEEIYRAKMMAWGGALLVVGIALSLGLFFWERSRRARQAEETELIKSNLVLEVEMTRRWAELTRGRYEVRSMMDCC